MSYLPFAYPTQAICLSSDNKLMCQTELSGYKLSNVRMLFFQENIMRLSAIVALSVLAWPALAKEPPTIIELIDGGGSQSFSGTSVGGEPTKFKIRSPRNGTITFQVSAKDDSCGVEMQTTSHLGYMSDFNRLPTSRIVAAKEGEVFTLSFFQNRIARVGKNACDFLLVVE